MCPLSKPCGTRDKAFKNFFARRAGYPVFKKRNGEQSAECTASAFTWDGEALTLAKMDGPLDIRWSRSLPKGCKPTTITVTRDTANRYIVSLLVEEEIKPLPVVNKMVGLDLGLTSMVVLSTGETIGNPRFFAKDEPRLVKAQRRLAKKKMGSRNRAKARQDVARIHARIADRRRDYKARWYGRTFVKIDRWYPSSKTCSSCQCVLEALSLDCRCWTCPVCGTLHDRDHNAAKNVLTAGLAVSACGEAVRPNTNGTDDRHASSKQETRLVRAAIPSPFGVWEDVKKFQLN